VTRYYNASLLVIKKVGLGTFPLHVLDIKSLVVPLFKESAEFLLGKT